MLDKRARFDNKASRGLEYIFKKIFFIRDPYTLQQLDEIAKNIVRLETRQELERNGSTELDSLGVNTQIIEDDFTHRQEVCIELFNNLSHISKSLQVIGDDLQYSRPIRKNALLGASNTRHVHTAILKYSLLKTLEGIDHISNYEGLIKQYTIVKDEIFNLLNSIQKEKNGDN